MAKKRYLDTRFWNDSYVADLDPSEKLLFIYCLTNQYTDICGVYEVPVKNVAMETGLDKEMVIKIFNRFTNDHKIFYIDGWIYVKNFQKHQIMNESIKKGMEQGIKSLPNKIFAKIQELDKNIVLNEDVIYKYKQLANGLRKKVLSRDLNKCVECGSPINLDIHHKIEKSAGGTDTMENLVTLCEKCHLKYTTQYNSEYNSNSYRVAHSVADCGRVSQSATYRDRDGDGDGDNILSCPNSATASLDNIKFHPSDFTTFWNAYPKKVGRKKVMDVFLKIKNVKIETIVKAIEEQKKSKQWQDTQFIPLPLTWLNQGRWEDELENGVDVDPYKQEALRIIKECDGDKAKAMHIFANNLSKREEFDKFEKYESMFNCF